MPGGVADDCGWCRGALVILDCNGLTQAAQLVIRRTTHLGRFELQPRSALCLRRGLGQAASARGLDMLQRKQDVVLVAEGEAACSEGADEAGTIGCELTLSIQRIGARAYLIAEHIKREAVRAGLDPSMLLAVYLGVVAHALNPCARLPIFRS